MSRKTIARPVFFTTGIVIATTLGAMSIVGCERKAEAVTPQTIAQQYGVPGAYNDVVPTSDGSIAGTLVPVTLADGRKAQLFVPQHQGDQPHNVYFRDDQGLHPVRINENATRDDVVRAPAVVGTRPEPQHAKKRPWEREALIIGGSAGAGTAIGAIAGGGKGAAIGATAGGVGGLIYDLTTRHK